MQFPVPQFTDVEDRIIAGLSFKQFGIIFAGGILTFVVYTASKNIPATIVGGILIMLPAAALSFGRLNGRPLYASAGNFFRYLIGAKLYVFHKQVYQNIAEDTPVEIKEEAPTKAKDTAVKIKELSYILQQQASEETLLIERINQNKQNK